mmetsp:Transcript_6990/g.24428  ORF Transcript_6990/g.24428 Transcript_6990/m.24428 type:complete len:87 (+) Transcript_6990:975-1235(+)
MRLCRIHRHSLPCEVEASTGHAELTMCVRAIAEELVEHCGCPLTVTRKQRSGSCTQKDDSSDKRRSALLASYDDGREEEQTSDELH